MGSTIKNLCEKFGITLSSSQILHKVVWLKEFDDYLEKPIIKKDNKNSIDDQYIFSNNNSTLIFYPNNKNRMVTYLSQDSPYNPINFNFCAKKVIKIEYLLRLMNLHLDLHSKILEKYIYDYDYYFDQKLINNEGYKSYIFKSETDTHEYMLTITPGDKEKTLIEYICPKGGNRRAFEEITRSDGSLYSIT